MGGGSYSMMSQLLLREEFLRAYLGPTWFSIQYNLAYSGTVEFKESAVRTLSWSMPILTGVMHLGQLPTYALPCLFL